MKQTLTIALAFISLSVFSQTDVIKTKSEVLKVSDQIIEHMTNYEFTESFDLAKKYWPLPENELDDLKSQTMKQFNLISARFGTPIGHEHIKDITVNDFIIRRVYVIKLGVHPIRVLITFYKGEKGWLINSLKWDDNIDALLEE